jgi:hypothetical protein
MIFLFLLLFWLLVIPVSLMLFKRLIGDLERGYEERQRNKWHKTMEEIVQANSREVVATHKARMASDPEYRTRNETYITKLRAGAITSE